GFAPAQHFFAAPAVVAWAATPGGRHAHPPRRPALRVRLPRFPGGPGGGRRAAAGRPVGAGHLPDWRRPEPVLPAPRAAAGGADAGSLAADRPDERPARLPRQARRAGCPARLLAHGGRGPAGLYRPARRGAEVALRLARAVGQRALPANAAHAQDRP